MQIYVSHNGEEFGPYSVEDLRLDFASGCLLPSDYARHEHASEWTPLAVFLDAQPVAARV
jgi:GYF domain 2